MKKFVLIAVAAGVLLGVSGCMFNNREVRSMSVYDLNLPHKAKPQSVFRVIAFGNDTAARSRMLYRKANNRVEQDPFNCWVQNPDQLLNRYYSLAYPINDNIPVTDLVEMRGLVTAFEADLNKSEAILTFNYIFRKDDRRESGTISVHEKFSGKTPEAFALAMARAAEKAGEQLALAAAKFHNGK